MTCSAPSASTSSTDGVGNTISRCSLENCTINNSNLRRCRLTNCVLSNVENAARTRAKNSRFSDVILAERSDIRESTVQSGSSVHRSDLRQSIAQEKTSLERSTLTGSIASQSRLRKTSLVDCDVAECVISRSNFKGMILKYGIWKKGVLVGKTGDREPIQMKKGAIPGATLEREQEISAQELPQELPTCTDIPELDSAPVGPVQIVELDSNTQERAIGKLDRRDDDSDVTVESDEFDDDLPPPYESAIEPETERSDLKMLHE
ncbi:unnamed protein product [Penicillium bialowiezense]